MTLLGGPAGLTGVRFGASPGLADADRWPAAFALATLQLRQYLAGDRERFDVLLDLSAGSEFQQRVWRAVREVPYGTTVTDAELARIVGRPSTVDAVAAAVSHAPVPIFIPCHRVLTTAGRSHDPSGRERHEALRDLEHNAVTGHPPDTLTYRGVQLADAPLASEPALTSSPALARRPLAAPRHHVLARSRRDASAQTR